MNLIFLPCGAKISLAHRKSPFAAESAASLHDHIKQCAICACTIKLTDQGIITLSQQETENPGTDLQKQK